MTSNKYKDSVLLHDVLRLHLTKEVFSDELIEEFKDANKLRNNIIHNAVIEISREQANNSLQYSFTDYTYTKINLKFYTDFKNIFKGYP